jgi:hypothetical protein
MRKWKWPQKKLQSLSPSSSLVHLIVIAPMICISKHHVYRLKPYYSIFLKMKICKKKTSMVLHTNFSLHCRKWSSFFSLHWNTTLLLRCWIWQAHMINLAIQTLSHLPLMFSIENMLQSMYNYFSHSPRYHLKFVKLVELVQTKGLKILKNVKMQSFSILSSTMRVMNEYQTLFVKMQQDSPTSTIVKTNFDHLANVQILLGLACFLPMLWSVHSFMQFAQKFDVFVCDYLASIKICQAYVYATLYKDPTTTHPRFILGACCSMMSFPWNGWLFL